jgi:hypothetical protein
MLLALAISGVAAAIVAACTSGDSGGAGGASSDAAIDGAFICNVDSFLEAGGNGAPCPMVSPVRCFACGEAGGCYCRPGEGGPRWQCIIDPNDPTCVPESGPRDDTGTGDDAPTNDAVTGDAPSSDAPGGDASDGGDASG